MQTSVYVNQLSVHLLTGATQTSIKYLGVLLSRNSDMSITGADKQEEHSKREGGAYGAVSIFICCFTPFLFLAVCSLCISV